MEDLTAGIADAAIYLPAIQIDFARFVTTKPTRADLSISPRDLNFLNHENPLFTYRHGLASAALFMEGKQPNAITHRDPGSHILGDSGGFSLGSTGKVPGFDGRDTDDVAALWRGTGTRFLQGVLRWLELNCDVAMTVDIPLWAKEPKFAKSPFHLLSVETLTNLTVENLRYFADNREPGTCDFLNVLHGRTDAEEEFWYSKVREFDFEGWAIGGSVGSVLDIRRVLRRLLILRDDKMLGGRKRWVHVLGIGQLKWAVILTAIKRGIELSIPERLTISFDTATPFTQAHKYQQYAIAPILTDNLKSWTIRPETFPTGYMAAVINADHPFPPGSPLSSILTLGDMNPKKSPYDPNTFDASSYEILSNHNVYVTVSACNAANRAAFDGGPLPQVLADLIGTIGVLFQTEEWRGVLYSDETLAIIEAAGFVPKGGSRA